MMDSTFLRADELGIRLEIVAGLPIWEPSPIYKHQKEVDRIRASIRKGTASSDPEQAPCRCIHTADVYVSFPDGSLKRPDISLFCRIGTPARASKKRGKAPGWPAGRRRRQRERHPVVRKHPKKGRETPQKARA